MSPEEFEQSVRDTLADSALTDDQQVRRIVLGAGEYGAWLIEQATRGTRIAITPGRSRPRASVVVLRQAGPDTFGTAAGEISGER